MKIRNLRNNRISKEFYYKYIDRLSIYINMVALIVFALSIILLYSSGNLVSPAIHESEGYTLNKFYTGHTEEVEVPCTIVGIEHIDSKISAVEIKYKKYDYSTATPNRKEYLHDVNPVTYEYQKEKVFSSKYADLIVGGKLNCTLNKIVNSSGLVEYEFIGITDNIAKE